MEIKSDGCGGGGGFKKRYLEDESSILKPALYKNGVKVDI